MPDQKPPLTLVLGPAGSGKTLWQRQRFVEGIGQSLWAVSSDGQAAYLRQSLAEETGYPERDFERSVTSFRAIVREIANNKGAGEPLHHLSAPLQRLMVAEICRTHIHRDDFLGQMRDSAGFVSALIDRIREWKLACITPVQLRQSAEALKKAGAQSDFVRKTEELARLFIAYEESLKTQKLIDAEDNLRIATEHLLNNALLPGSANLLLIDGYFRLNRAQLELFRAMVSSKNAPELVLTLPYDASQPLLFAASERTLQTLREEFNTKETVCSPLSTPTPLNHLSTHLFTLSPSPTPPTKAPSVCTPIQLFDAPNNYVEAEMVAREFSRIYAKGGYTWSDFMVILRTQGEYAPILASVFERYNIPLGIDSAECLADNPMLKTILRLFAIFQNGWQRDDVLSFLKSSYTLPDKLEADAMRQLSRARRVREGREAWLTLASEERAGLESIRKTFSLLTEFEETLRLEYAAPSHFAERVLSAVEVFGLLERIDQGEPMRAIRDRAVWKSAQEVLDSLVRMAWIGRRATLSQEEFFRELGAAWRDTSALALMLEESVRVVEPYETREAPARVAAVMGLTEKVFPRKITEDPFFRDDERQILRHLVGFDLEDQRGRSDDERLLFYFAVTAPKDQLILTFPRTSDESDALPSFYLDEVRHVFEGIEEGRLVTESRTLADVVPRPTEIVSEGDNLLSLCGNLFEPPTPSEPDLAIQHQREALERLRTALREMPEKILRILNSRLEPRLPRLESPTLRDDFTQTKTSYSVSELEAFRRCPFQYLLRYVWRLHAEEDGGNPRTQGTLLHAILRHYFRSKRESRQPIPHDAETLLSELHAVMEEQLSLVALDTSAHRAEMLIRMLRDALAHFAEREARFAPLFDLTPRYFELAFGQSTGNARIAEDEDREGGHQEDFDPASQPTALELKRADGQGTVQICGTIDRVDTSFGQNYGMVMDYKLGKPPEPRDMESGQSLQLPLYMLALERVFGITAGVGCYDSVRQAGRPRLYRPEIAPNPQFRPTPGEEANSVKPLNRTQYADLLRIAELTAVNVVQEIEEAQVYARPGQYCSYCPYADTCRTSLLHGHDGEPLSQLR
jgi:ATP-dependent helicase/nuclease subunit B